MVFYKRAYGSAQQAQLKGDGLVVLAFFYEVSPRPLRIEGGNAQVVHLQAPFGSQVMASDNAVYSEMVDYLPQIVRPHTKFNLRRQLTLASLIPCARSHYFTYHGSLTTPPCLEVVTWIDFKHPIRLSHAQVGPPPVHSRALPSATPCWRPGLAWPLPTHMEDGSQNDVKICF